MRLPLKRLSTDELRRTWGAAQSSVNGFAQATAETGSLIQSWVGGAPVMAMEHYPPSDVTDRQHGYQFFYHCHRDGGLEHGHVHVFAHATRSGRKRRLRGDNHWVRTDPSHLIAIGLDARGLPVSMFTVNRWVTGGHWLDAPTSLRWLQGLTLSHTMAHAHSCQWLAGFVRMYLPVAAILLSQRDRWLSRQADRTTALDDPRAEVLSAARIDWASDLRRLEAEWTLRHPPAP
jgi:hypothetical protein